jgi:DnaJ-class molecular chaperone
MLRYAEECPTCGGVGFVTQRVDLRGEAESVAFVRFECPNCGGTGRITPSALDDPK